MSPVSPFATGVTQVTAVCKSTNFAPVTVAALQMRFLKKSAAHIQHQVGLQSAFLLLCY